MEFGIKSDVFYRCVEHSNEAIMITGLDGLLVYVNPAWVRIYGFSLEEAVGKNPRILHSGHHSKEFYSEMWAQVSDPAVGSWKGEVINRTKDGKLIPVLLSITPFRGSDQRIEGYMGIALDLSRRKELEAKVSQQDRLASVGLLASGLAHEIGTPLGVIRGRAEILQMQTKEPSLASALDVIIGQIDRISRLIRSLLRVSRSNTDLRLQDVSLKEVIDDVLSLVGQNFRADGVSLVVDIDSNARVFADFDRLEQVLLNLLMNAIHAIRSIERPEHQVKIGFEMRGMRAALTVSDTGCGISADHMKKLFKPFFTTKAVGEGTGLGLAICAQIAHEMGGEIIVESQLGKGSTFTILLRSQGA